MRENETLTIPLERKPGPAGPLVVREMCGKGGLTISIAEQLAEPDMHSLRIEKWKRRGCEFGVGHTRHHSPDMTGIACITPMTAQPV